MLSIYNNFLNEFAGEVISEITADEILNEYNYMDIDIYDHNLVVSTNDGDNDRVLFYKLND